MKTSQAETWRWSTQRTQDSGNPGRAASLADLCDKFVEDVNIADAEGFSRVLSSLVTSLHSNEMAARAGIEPVLEFLQTCVAAAGSGIAKSADAQLRTQGLEGLRGVVKAWPKLSPELRAAVLAVTRSAIE